MTANVTAYESKFSDMRGYVGSEVAGNSEQKTPAWSVDVHAYGCRRHLRLHTLTCDADTLGALPKTLSSAAMYSGQGGPPEPGSEPPVSSRDFPSVPTVPSHPPCGHTQGQTMPTPQLDAWFEAVPTHPVNFQRDAAAHDSGDRVVLPPAARRESSLRDCGATEGVNPSVLPSFQAIVEEPLPSVATVANTSRENEPTTVPSSSAQQVSSGNSSLPSHTAQPPSDTARPVRPQGPQAEGTGLLKIMKWSESLDLALIMAVNVLGSFKELGHGQKGPAFNKVSEQCAQISTFASVKHLLTGKKCADRFDRLLKEHRIAREQNKNRSGTDDEEVSDKTQILDDICDFIDDAKENFQSAAAKKRDEQATLVSAGQMLRQRAMQRGPRRKRKSDSTNDSPPSGDDVQGPLHTPVARGAAVVDSDGDAEREPETQAPQPEAQIPQAEGNHCHDAVPSTPTGGPTVVTPASGRRMKRMKRVTTTDEDDEMDMLHAAAEREKKRLENEQARLELDREGLQTRKQDLELRKEQQELSRLEIEARLKIERERSEEEKLAREADRAERKSQSEHNAKVLDALMNTVSMLAELKK